MLTSAVISMSLIGIFCHWLKSWLRETITSNFILAPKHTGAMLFTLATALITGYQSLTIAFTADSAVNKEG